MGISAGGLRAGRAVIELGLVGAKGVETVLNNLQKRVGVIGQKISGIGSASGMTDGFSGLRNLFVGSMATDALLYPIKLASNIELASAQLSVFTGDAGTAKDMMIELQKFSAVAFIPAEQLGTAAAMLIRYGVAQNRVVADTKAMAVVAGGSTDEFEKLSLAYAQVASAGRLQGEEMRQFKNTAFNPLREIAQRTGETMLQVKKRMEDGKVSFEEVANALQGATGAGGRFAGMLSTISNTLRGQINKALSQLKLAVLPIGDDALKPLTEFFKKINMIIPSLAEFIKKNVAWFRGIMEGSAAIAAAATAFVALGLLGAVVSIAFGGFAAIISAIATGFIALAPIIGVLFLAMKGLGIGFSDVGREIGLWLGVISEKLLSLYARVKEVFGAIINAMAGGDFKLAANILWAALSAAWQTGVAALMGLWIEFKFGFAAVMTGLVAELKTIWIGFYAWFSHKLEDLEYKVTSLVGRLMKESPEDAWTAARAHIDAHKAIDAEAAQKTTDVNWDAMKDLILLGTGKTAALAGAGATAAASVAALNALMAQAAGLIAGKGAALGDFGLGMQVALGNLTGKVGDKAMKPEALFDTRLAAQTFGGGDDVEAQQLNELKGINKGVAQLEGAGLAFG